MNRPNILFLMMDQMQGRVLGGESLCQTPHIDRVASRGLSFQRAYTPNAVCSPARASLMTGLLPHNHGVMWVHHCVDKDQGLLRTEHPHWAQRLRSDGYRTGYFGKWHVENTERPEDFGWDHDGSMRSPAYQEAAGTHPRDPDDFVSAWKLDNPGYQDSIFYGVTSLPPEQRPMGRITALAREWLSAAALSGDQPWCCFVSVPEPHDPFICGVEARSLYESADIVPPPNWGDELTVSPSDLGRPQPDASGIRPGRPGIYRKAARVWLGMTTEQKQEAAACYYASITEIDTLFGGIIDQVEAAGQLENTIVVVTSDHGEMLGAHGLYCKNLSAVEEVYNIPLVISGPGVVSGMTTGARVGLHDLCPTLLDLTDAEPIATTDSRSFSQLLSDPDAIAEWQDGYAEYHGGRYILTQRILWQEDWKFVHNGFDMDELYNLAEDPWELTNLIDEPAEQDRVVRMMKAVWEKINATGDRALMRPDYPILRLAPVGPHAD